MHIEAPLFSSSCSHLHLPLATPWQSVSPGVVDPEQGQGQRVERRQRGPTSCEVCCLGRKDTWLMISGAGSGSLVSVSG